MMNEQVIFFKIKVIVVYGPGEPEWNSFGGKYRGK